MPSVSYIHTPSRVDIFETEKITTFVLFTDLFLDIKKYLEQASECGSVPSLSGFVRENTDLVVRSPPKGHDFNSLDGAWKKRFRSTAEILNIKGIMNF